MLKRQKYEVILNQMRKESFLKYEKKKKLLKLQFLLLYTFFSHFKDFSFRLQLFWSSHGKLFFFSTRKK